VGDNSFPNIFAIVSGYSPEKAKEHVCDTDEKGCLDEIPMIWKYFKNASYLTAYAEDESSSNTFTYLKPGFTKKPTDYYFRPFLRALENKMDNYNCPDCRIELFIRGVKKLVGHRFVDMQQISLQIDIIKERNQFTVI